MSRVHINMYQVIVVIMRPFEVLDFSQRTLLQVLRNTEQKTYKLLTIKRILK